MITVLSYGLRGVFVQDRRTTPQRVPVGGSSARELLRLRAAVRLRAVVRAERGTYRRDTFRSMARAKSNEK